MKNFSIKYIYNLFKSAAEDIAPFYPEWVKTHPEIKKLKKLTDVKKEMPVADFRVPVEINMREIASTDISKFNFISEFVSSIFLIIQNSQIPIREMRDNLYGQLSNLSSDQEEYNLLQDKINKLDQLDTIVGLFYDSIYESAMLSAAETGTEELKKILITSEDIKFTLGKSNLFYPKGSFIPRVANNLSEIYQKLTGQPLTSGMTHNFSNLREIPSYKKLEYLFSDKYKKEIEAKSKGNFEVVFSSQPSDLLSMSIRGNWTSCQDLLKDQSEHNPKAIYSAISPYVGIIYITSKNPYKDRGEEMVARSLVFYVENKRDKRPALTIGQVYSNFHTNVFYQKFEEALKAKSSISVISYEDAIDDYYFPTENESEEKNPYFDPSFKGKKNVKMELRRRTSTPQPNQPFKLDWGDTIDIDSLFNE